MQALTSAPRTSTPNLHGHVVAKIVNVLPGLHQRILDLGCGSGALLESLKRHGYTDLCGVDIKPPESTQSISYFTADLDYFSLPIADSSFDLAIAVEVIEHIENPGLFLTEVARLLKPGGLVLFTTPNVHSSQAKLLFGLTDRLKQFDRKGDPTHIYPVFLFPFERLLGRHGFEVIQRWGFPLNGSSPTSRQMMRIAAWVLRPILKSPIAHGDNLCLLARRCGISNASHERDTKAAMLTAHYR